MFDKLLDLILKYENITIFRHRNPDGDALGSQFGLKSWINDNFKDKKVYCLGDFATADFFTGDEADDETVKSSLAIILDVSNADRVDDLRFKTAAYSIRIDHHPFVEDFTDLKIAETRYASTCEMITEFIKEHDEKYPVSTETAKRLYRGILTDTLSFRTTNTTGNSLRMAAFLADKSIDIPQLNADIYNISYDEFKFINYLRSKLVFDEGLAYSAFEEKELSKMNISINKAKSKVSSLGGVNDFEIWAIFVKNNDNLYDVSLRSKKVQINDIANKYGGGGHYNASGIKAVSEENFQQLLVDLKNRIKGIA